MAMEKTTTTTGNSDNNKSMRARDRLKAYYGLSDKEGVKKGGELDLDGKEFQVEGYLGGLYKESRVVDLIRKDNEWVGEIRKLDSDRKNLVYENYNKFIKASVSISNMKSDLLRMKKELTEATTTMESISTCSQKINGGLEPSRRKLDDLYQKNATLKKLRFIFELPDSLKLNVEKGNLEEAIRQYSSTASLLHRYQHLEVFSGIAQECQVIMKQVELKLSEQVESDKSSLQDSLTSLRLLMGLKRELTETQVYTQLLKTGLPKLKSIISHHRNKLTDLDLTQPQPNHLDSLKSFHDELLPNLDHFVSQFFAIFVRTPSDPLPTHHLVSYVEVTESSLNKLREQFSGEIYELFDQGYCQVIQLFHQVPATTCLTTVNLNQFTDIFSYCLTTLADYANLSGRNSFVNLVQRFRLSICDWEKRVIDTLFEEAKLSFSNRLESLWHPSTPRDYLSDPFTAQASLLAVKNDLMEYLLNKIQPQLEKFISSDIAFWQLSGTWGFFFRYLQTSFRRNWESLLLLDHPITDLTVTSSEFLLLKARLFLDLHVNVIQTVYDSYIKGIIQSLSIPHTHQPSEDEVIEEWIGDCVSLLDQSQLRSQAILKQAAIQIGHSLHYQLYSYLDTVDWVTHPKPSEVTSAWIKVWEEYQAYEKWIGVFFPSKEDPDAFTSSTSRNSEVYSPERGSFQAGMTSFSIASPRRNSFSLGVTSSPFSPPGGHPQPNTSEAMNKQKHLMAHIDRLFSERIHIFSPVRNSLEAILVAITKTFLKANSEAVRLFILGPTGFQQFQLDLEYFKRVVAPSLPHDLAIPILLDELALSILKRSLTPIYLEEPDLLALLEPSLGTTTATLT